MKTREIEEAGGHRRRYIAIFTLAIALVVCVVRYGGMALINSNQLPEHVGAAVVLQGSIAGENARVAGAMRLLQTGTAGVIVLSVPHESYWGQLSEPAARQYMEKTYGSDLAHRLEFCETGPEVNSTEDEAKVVGACLFQRGWQTVAVVTSDYHTRRAGLIWRKVMKAQDPHAQIWIHGVNDPEFSARGWWRQRIYAKTFFLEFTKLLWTLLTLWR